MNTPKKGSLKSNPTYTKKKEVASSTAGVDRMKDIRQDPKNKITFTNVNGTLVTNVKNNQGKVTTRSYSYKEPFDTKSTKVKQTASGNKLIKKVNKPAAASGKYTEKVDTSGYSKGKERFPYEFSYPEVKNLSKTGKTQKAKSSLSREQVKEKFILKKGGTVKSKKK